MSNMEQVKLNPTQKSQAAPKGEYGVFTDVVNLMTTQYTQEKSDGLKTHVPPIYITPYDQWTAKDFVKLQKTFPVVYSTFSAMYKLVAADQDILSPTAKQFAQDAVKAMTRLSGDGDWKRYARIIGEAESLIASQKKVSLNDAKDLIQPANAMGLQLDGSSEYKTPDPKAAAKQAVAGLKQGVAIAA